jgi:hypothetical protein
MDERRLSSAVVPVADLAHQDVVEMFGIHARLYERVSESEFLRDLEEKHWVLLLRDDRTGAIRGFTTILLLHVVLHGEPLQVVFSGDTGIAPEFWGGQALVKAWAGFMGSVRIETPSRRLFWFLISKGYRTYLYLPLFFHSFYPRVDAPTPPFELDLIRTLGTLKYPRDFNPNTGVIEFAVSHGHLAPPLAEISDHRREHRHVRFFLEKNPDYARGHELVCVAEISPENMRGLARRMLIEGSRPIAAGA